MDPVTKDDVNIVNFMNHLKDLARNKELITFDPLKDDPKLFLENVLLKKPSLKNPGSVFKSTNSPDAIIRTYTI
jgi:hypothetical protein